MGGFRWFGGDFRGGLAVERKAEMLEVWSRLGGELEVILLRMEALVSDGKEEEEEG